MVKLNELPVPKKQIQKPFIDDDLKEKYFNWIVIGVCVLFGLIIAVKVMQKFIG